MEICGEARGIMRADGNMTQWTGGYPSEDVIRADSGWTRASLTAQSTGWPAPQAATASPGPASNGCGVIHLRDGAPRLAYQKLK